MQDSSGNEPLMSAALSETSLGPVRRLLLVSVLCLIAIPAICVTPNKQPAGSKPIPNTELYTKWNQLLEYESRCDFNQAYLLGTRLPPLLDAWDGNTTHNNMQLDKDSAKRHLAHLTSLHQVEILIDSEEMDKAKAALDKLLAEIAPDSKYDGAILGKVKDLLVSKVKPVLRAPWDKRIEEARALLQHGLANEAKSLFSAKEWTRDQAPLYVRDSVDQVLLDIDKQLLYGKSGSSALLEAVKSLRDTLDKILLVIIVIVLYAIYSFIQWIWFVVWKELLINKCCRLPGLIRRFAPKTLTTTYINIVNLSSKNSDDKKEESDSRRISGRLAQAVTSLCVSHYQFSDENEAMKEAENEDNIIRVTGLGPTTDIVVQSDASFKFGLFSVNLAPLFRWLQDLVSTRRFAICYEGTLRSIADVYGQTGYELFMRRRRSATSKHFYAFTVAGTEDGGVDALIDLLAFQLVIDVWKSNTHSPQSLRHYVRGMSILEANIEEYNRCQSLETAVNEFHASIAYDEDNWLAYYNLGFALHHLGRFLDAAAYFERVLKMLNIPVCAELSRGMQTLLEYRQRYAFLPQYLQWHICHNQARCDNAEIIRKTVNDLDSLIRELHLACKNNAPVKPPHSPGEGGRHNPGPCRLMWHCRADKMAALAGLMQLTQDPAELTGLSNAIKQIWDEFTAPSEQSPPFDILAHVNTAYGLALYAHQKTHAAIERLWAAINMQSGFGDPEPYDLLARIYLDNTSVSKNWCEKAKLCIDNLRKIRPDNPNSAFLYARWLFITKQYDEASKAIKNAGYSPDAMILWDEIETAIEKKKSQVDAT